MNTKQRKHYNKAKRELNDLAKELNADYSCDTSDIHAGDLLLSEAEFKKLSPEKQKRIKTYKQERNQRLILWLKRTGRYEYLFEFNDATEYWRQNKLYTPIEAVKMIDKTVHEIKPEILDYYRSRYMDAKIRIPKKGINDLIATDSTADTSSKADTDDTIKHNHASIKKYTLILKEWLREKGHDNLHDDIKALGEKQGIDDNKINTATNALSNANGAKEMLILGGALTCLIEDKSSPLATPSKTPFLQQQQGYGNNSTVAALLRKLRNDDMRTADTGDNGDRDWIGLSDESIKGSNGIRKAAIKAWKSKST